MGLLLPFLAAWLYAGEAAACHPAGPFRVDYCVPVTAYTKAPFYFVTEADHNRVCVKTLDVPKGKVRKGYECSIKLPGAADFVPFDCNLTAITGWIKNIPVQHGYNEIKVVATTKDGERSQPLVAGWYVKMRPEAPVPRIQINGMASALPNNSDGSCNPLIIPLIAENGSAVHYVIDGREYNTGKLNEAGAPAKPPYLVNYDLQTQGRTALAAGETFTMTLWAEEALPLDAKGKKWQTVSSAKRDWTVICPGPPTPILVEIEPPTPLPGYASKATLKFSAVDGTTPDMYCSLNGAPYVPCDTPNSQFYENLTAGEQIFRVYATPGTFTQHIWYVYPPDVVWTAMLPPLETTATSVSFSFGPANGVDLPVIFSCRLDGAPFEVCVSPKEYSGLTLGEHTFEVYATSTVGTGQTAGHTWKVVPPGGGSGPIVQPNRDNLQELSGGCSTAAGMPLGLMALAGLWALARRRRT